MKIAVAGTGYVGLSMATLLAQHHSVVAVDVVPEKVEKINRRESPIQDEYIQEFFAGRELNLVAVLDSASAYRDAEYAWMGFIVKVQTEFLNFLQLLRPRYRLAVLSNTNPFIQGWARSSAFTPDGKSLDDYFDSLFLSYKMNCSKPSEDIYKKMLLEGNMNPQETLFIDDGEKNIAAARRTGINVLKVANGEDWREILEKTLAVYR